MQAQAKKELQGKTANGTGKKEKTVKSNVNLNDPFKAVNHGLRREMLQTICEAGGAGIIFSEIWGDYKDVLDERTGKNKYSKSNVSQHLDKLARAELVIVRREGGNKRFFPDFKEIAKLKDFTAGLK